VNVSSGTSSPGQSRTKGHKTIVVVVVVLLMNVLLPDARADNSNAVSWSTGGTSPASLTFKRQFKRNYNHRL